RVAPARAHLAQLQRSSEELAHLLVERGRPLFQLILDDQRLARARREPVVFRKFDRARRARARAIGAEEAAPEIERQPVLQSDCVRRTRLDARAAPFGTLLLIDPRRAPKAIREHGLFARILSGAMALSDPREQHVQHRSLLTSRVRSTRG